MLIMKTIYFRLIAIGLLFVILFGACNKDTEIQPRKIELTFPADWDITFDVNEYVAVQGASPQQSGSDIFLENINASFEKIPGYSLQAYFDANKDAFSTLTAFEDFTIIYQSDTTLNNYSAKKLIFTATMQNIPLKFIDFFLYEDGYGFVITCTSEESTYDEFESIFEGIAGTVKIN
jgi:hypothetical protein